MITNEDLRKRQYTMDELADNIEHLSISTLLKYQHLTLKFCEEFILNESFQSVEEQYKVDVQYVLKRQPHLIQLPNDPF